MPQDESTIDYAEIDDDIVVIRVNGRGTFQNSMCLEKLEEAYENQGRNVRYILDLGECKYMDSTFMGVLALLGNKQTGRGHEKMAVHNLNNHTHKLLSTLGLTQILECKEDTNEDKDFSGDFKEANTPETSKYNQIIHMIDAHKKLVDLDGQNEVRFESVIKFLEENLQREEQQQKSS